MSSENLKTPCLLEGSKWKAAKHLGLHNVSSPLFIGGKKMVLESTSYFESTEFFPSFFFLFLAKCVFDYLKIISILNCI